MAVRAPGAGSARTTARAPTPRPIYYPESDGKPIGETDDHVLAILDALFKLRMHFRDRADVYVASNNLLYYEEGNPRRVVSPDVYVVRGVANRRRRIYKLWDEGIAPSFVLEVSSRGTRRADLVTKRELYARLGVGEYLIFDPLGEYLTPRLIGFRLAGGAYEPIAAEADGAIRSPGLGVELRAGGPVVRVIDLASGNELVGPDDVYRAHESAEAARQRAEAAHESAEAARQRAEAAHRAAQAEIARLRAEIVRRGPDARG